MHAHHQLPSPDAIEQAISLLLASFPDRGGHPDASETNATEDILEKGITELELSASAIHRELHLRAARLKRRRNSFKRIYQLPEEVFAEILVIDVLDFDLEEEERFSQPRPRITLPAVRRARLCNVSHRFLQTVMTTPRIWSDICWRRDDYLRLLQMSAQAPLMIRCLQSYPTIIKAPGTKEEFLSAVWEHSERWKALSLDLPLNERCLPSPEFPAPQLRDLNVKVHGFDFMYSRKITLYVFKISGNPSLRNLSLTKAGLQWDGIDLSHLKSLSLSSIEQGAPSLEKLVETLRMASGLETLCLRQVNTVSLDEEQQLELQPIHLNSLISLYIAEMPAGLADYLITIIRTPQLKTSHVHGLLLKHLENPDSDQNPYHHFFRVIIPTLAVRGSRNLALCNDLLSKVVSLEPDSEFITMPPSADAAIGNASFGMEVESPIQGVEAMVEFLTSYRIDCLTVIASGRKFPSSRTTYPPPSSESYFPAEVLGKLPMVTKISVHMLVDALNILNFLSSPRRDEGTGRFGWACPQLEELYLEGVRGLKPDHIQTFVDGRKGDGNPLIIEGQVVQRPRWVQIQNQEYISTLPWAESE